MYRVVTETMPDADEIQVIRDGLRAFNLAAVPSLVALPGDDFNVVLYDESGSIVGGAVAEADLGWLFVDTLWVSATIRGLGYGRRILNAVEQEALRQGIRDVWLMTTDFQALDFYRKLGYQVAGFNEHRPPGHRLHYLTRTGLQPAPYDTTLTIEHDPLPQTTHTLNHGLIQSSKVPLRLEPLAIFVRDDDETILGGLAGSSFWGWFDLRYLWLDDRLRGQGYGQKLLAALDDECHVRGLRGIASDTLDWQALPFYRKHGFEVVFTLANRPPGHTAYFIQKLLEAR